MQLKLAGAMSGIDELADCNRTRRARFEKNRAGAKQCRLNERATAPATSFSGLAGWLCLLVGRPGRDASGPGNRLIQRHIAPCIPIAFNVNTSPLRQGRVYFGLV